MTDKTLKDFFEVYKPKSPDEQKFVDKHVTIKHKDRNGNGDDVFNAANIKTIKRKEERHGYDSGEDEKVYEEAEESEIDTLLDQALDMLNAIDEKTLTPAEMKKREEVVKAIKRDDPKMDKSMAYAIATKTAKRVAEEAEDLDEMSSKMKMKLGLYGKKKKMKEEAEYVDELSRATLTRYTQKAGRDISKLGSKKVDAMMSGDNQKAAALIKKQQSRTDMQALARNKMNPKVRVHATEEAEYVDELSRSTLGSYAKKAIKDAPEKDRMGKAFSDLAGDDAKRGDREGASEYGKRAVKAYTKAANRRVGVEKAIDKMAKEELELDESAKVAAHLIKRYGDNVRKSHVRSAANDFGVGYVALSHAVRKKLGVNRLEEEQIDELSKELTRSYFNKALDSGVRAASRQWRPGSTSDANAAAAVAKKRAKGLKMASKRMAQEEVEQIDETPKSAAELIKNKIKKAEANAKARDPHTKIEREEARAAKMLAAGSKPRNEEVEQVDEISKATMGRYINKAKDQIDAASYRQGHRDSRGSGGDTVAKGIERKLSKRHGGIELAVKKLTKEDAEQIDELSKGTLGSYVKKASTQSFGKGYTGASMLARSLHTRDKEEEKAGEKEVNKGVRRLAGISKATDRLTKEDIINKAISKFVAEDHELPSIDDRFLAAIEHLPESHIATLFGLFDNLSEENQLVMIDTVATTEGVNSLIDFAIENTRGE